MKSIFILIVTLLFSTTAYSARIVYHGENIDIYDFNGELTLNTYFTPIEYSLEANTGFSDAPTSCDSFSFPWGWEPF